MCGIIGYAGSRPALPILLEGLHRLEYRGADPLDEVLEGLIGVPLLLVVVCHHT